LLKWKYLNRIIFSFYNMTQESLEVKISGKPSIKNYIQGSDLCGNLKNATVTYVDNTHQNLENISFTIKNSDQKYVIKMISACSLSNIKGIEVSGQYNDKKILIKEIIKVNY